jgi:hypothetical protein
LILLRAFALWGLPEEILSDNAGAFISLLYRLLLGVLRVKVSYTIPVVPGRIHLLSLSLAHFGPTSIRTCNTGGLLQEFRGYMQIFFLLFILLFAYNHLCHLLILLMSSSFQFLEDYNSRWLLFAMPNKLK